MDEGGRTWFCNNTNGPASSVSRKLEITLKNLEKREKKDFLKNE